MRRRDFFRTLAAGATPAAAAAAAGREKEWNFIHFTDPHIQPELKADEGCRQAFRKMNRMHADFALSGGDLVFDVLGAGRPRADALFKLYLENTKRLEIPLHNTIGNHDVFGLYTRSGVAPSAAQYGKRMYEDVIGKRYYSFDHKGWHFIILDSIGMTAERDYIGEVDDEQLTWLRNDLTAAGTAVPVVLATHIPLLSAFPQIVAPPGAPTRGMLVTNVRDVLKVLEPYKVKAVLQGHTHICETIHYHGTQFITSGAVSGNWWKGKRLGFDEGFGVLTVRGEEITWRYETYGWQTVAPA